MRSSVFFSMIGLASIVSCVSVFGCNAGADEGDHLESAQTSATCRVFSSMLKRDLTAEELLKLDDPIARFVLNAPGGCPTSFEDIQRTLRKTDTENCEDDPAGPPAGTVTWLESDRSQLTKVPDAYRSVTSRKCGGRTGAELLISNQTLRAVPAAADGTPQSPPPLPHGMVAFGQDRTSRAFNFYAPHSDNRWTFVGSSTELLAGGYDCNADGACLPKTAATVGCTACHAGGGLSMQELRLPWVNWDEQRPMPGSRELFDAYSQFLGKRSLARDLERIVTQGNAEWIKTRVAFLKTLGTEELLRPLFCTIDVNVRTSTGPQLSQVRTDLWLDPRWKISESVPVDAADYAKILDKNKQRIQSALTGSQLVSKDGPVFDTAFPLIYPERSGMDARYVEELVRQEVVDEDFVRDVLFTDFTRPTFSPTRCDLVKNAPKLSATEMNPTSIRDGFKASLTNVSSDEAKAFLARLSDPNDGEAHLTAVNEFVAACRTRAPAELLEDVVTYASQLRNAARKNKTSDGRGLQVFAENLPFDSLPDGRGAFDPKTCKLR
jgi:hypothetical protein